MNNVFISLVSVIETDIVTLKKFVVETSAILKENFENYEIILINNGQRIDYYARLKELTDVNLSHFLILNLSKPVEFNNAIVAGLDHSNGDYTVVINSDLTDPPSLIPALYLETQKKFDIVYVRSKNIQLSLFKKIFFKSFYFIMKHFSDLDLDYFSHDYLIISRRALNVILGIREKIRFMKAIYSFVGYKRTFIEVDYVQTKRPFGLFTSLKKSFHIITSYSSILNKLLLVLIFLTISFSFLFSLDAILVKYTGKDIFGTAQQQIPGWTFLVIMMSIMFSFNIIILYILSIFLENIQTELKNRPIYILESVQKL